MALALLENHPEAGRALSVSAAGALLSRRMRRIAAVDPMADTRPSWYAEVVSTRESSGRIVTSRVFRAGETPPEDDWSETSVGERIDAVLELSRQCLEWTRTGTDEPRLQRSVSRIQRPQR